MWKIIWADSTKINLVIQTLLLYQLSLSLYENTPTPFQLHLTCTISLLSTISCDCRLSICLSISPKHTRFRNFTFSLCQESFSCPLSIFSFYYKSFSFYFIVYIYTAMKNEWVSDNKRLFLPKVQYNLLWAFPYIALSVERYIILDVLLQCTLY